MGLLLQCVYIGFWATNFVLIALDSYHPAVWEIVLLLPLPLNFFILKQIIFTSSILKSISTLDEEVSDKICEQAVDERNVTAKLRQAVRRSLETEKIENNLPESMWFQFLSNRFHDMLTTTNSTTFSFDGMSKRKFRAFLHSLHIFLTDESTSSIFTVLDVDRDGRITWDQLQGIVFPELQKKTVKVIKVKVLVLILIANLNN